VTEEQIDDFNCIRKFSQCIQGRVNKFRDYIFKEFILRAAVISNLQFFEVISLQFSTLVPKLL
jgi:hypothetical protein